MQKYISFWWKCAVNAKRGSAAFGNDWQWLIGFPVLAAVLWLLHDWDKYETEKFLTGGTVLGTVITAGIAFLITMAGCFLIRLWIAPALLFYAEEERADIAERELKERFTPKIKVLLGADKGIQTVPMRSFPPDGPPQDGPPSKWAQIIVCCATNAALVDCEVWLTSVKRISNGDTALELLEEDIACHWSQISDEKITISVGRSPRANIFSIYGEPQVFYRNDTPKFIRQDTRQCKWTLFDGIQVFGTYRIKATVTAQNAPSYLASFIFEWHGFTNCSLVQE